MDRDFIYRQTLVWLEHEGIERQDIENDQHDLESPAYLLEYREQLADSLTNHLWNNWEMVERTKSEQRRKHAKAHGHATPSPTAICECYYECYADSHSGNWHTHEDEPCPIHPEATMAG